MFQADWLYAYDVGAACRALAAAAPAERAPAVRRTPPD
jgi:hypothetical protein